MSVTFFNLHYSDNKQKVKNDTPKEKLVELTQIVEPEQKSYMTYVDIDGVEKHVVGGFSKTIDGSYVIQRTEVDTYPIEEKTVKIMKDVDTHLAYIDNTGKERVFNRLDTLVYDEETNSYVGEVGNIEYIENEVELIEK